MRTLLIVLLALGLANACRVAVVRALRHAPDQVVPVGPFEVVVGSRSYTTGWNEGRFQRGTIRSYHLRHRGKKLPIRGRAGFFGKETAVYDRVSDVVALQGAEPALIVNVGDGNNTSWYYLVREVDGQVTVQELAATNGRVAWQWLDVPPDSVNAYDGVTDRARPATGARWLLLGLQTVFDTQTLTAYPFEAAEDASAAHNKPPLAMSPDRGSFAALGSGDSPENAPLILVSDFRRGKQYTLPIDKRTMRSHNWHDDIDAAWLDHHFEWRRGADGRDRLVRRARFTPLPFRGRLSGHDAPDADREYRIEPVKTEMFERVVAFLEREFGATRLPPTNPGWDRPGRSPSGGDSDALFASIEMRMRDHTINVMLTDHHVGVWMTRDHGPDTRVIAEIARRFDAELRTGAYDALFLP